uniref:uncharacterized protein zgc:112980 n=1 Tax=Scatophagus argus TaxID=75038 RepID=UPI001ED801E8|nr:uncharacterized protein zgc:112980 [Scatophagus argus]XP_046227330.1 uncharacterized protein zgc:112980 [Scatophagus argus]
MCTTVDSGEIIILSDDDDDDDDDEDCEPHIFYSELSVHTVEVEDEEKDCVLPLSVLDEDLVVTFSRPAEVLPHARYDCHIHPFTATDCETGVPVDTNQLICDQCFCYICDKLASSCVMWCQRGVCHCNSHHRSSFWNNLRDNSLLGDLKAFNLTLSEIDVHLRQADTMLQSFRQELAAQFTCFLKGTPLDEYSLSLPNLQGPVYDYTPVYELVSSFLNNADKQDNRAAAIMRLGATECFIRHFEVAGNLSLPSPTADAAQAKVLLLQRVVSSMQREMVTGDFTPEFTHKLRDFYKKLCFPAHLKHLKNSLCVRPWDDVLLVSVLKGQNVSGVRKDKGKKVVLIEHISVVLLRTEELQRQLRYRELCRYLRVVQSENPELLQQLRDLIPVFMCMEGDFTSALQSLFSPASSPASRFTPHLFLFYLRIFKTATVPKLAVSRPAELCCTDAPWEPIKGAVPMKRDVQVKFALRVQGCCSAVFTDSQCWMSVLTVVNTPRGSITALPAPSLLFLHEAKAVVNSILLSQNWSSIQIPRSFQEVYPDQALLLLVTGALGVRILNSALSPAVPVLNTFKDNLWALEWLWDSLSSNAGRLSSFLQEITQEMENTTDGESLLSFLRACEAAQSSPAEICDDHTYCGPVPVKLYSSQVLQCQLADSLSH